MAPETRPTGDWGLGRARTELSGTRRVAGSDGLADYTWKAINNEEIGLSVERRLYSYTTSSLGSGLKTHTVTENDSITEKSNTGKLKWFKVLSNIYENSLSSTLNISSVVLQVCSVQNPTRKAQNSVCSLTNIPREPLLWKPIKLLILEDYSANPRSCITGSGPWNLQPLRHENTRNLINTWSIYKI